jgi:hypothetical protein
MSNQPKNQSQRKALTLIYSCYVEGISKVSEVCCWQWNTDSTGLKLCSRGNPWLPCFAPLIFCAVDLLDKKGRGAIAPLPF